MSKILAVLLLVVPCTALAASPRPIMILSEGATTCGEFIAQPAMQTIRMEWVLGYISGVNAGISRSAKASQAETMAGQSFERTETAIGWLQGYCSAHPLDVLVSAAEALRNDFMRHERLSR